MDFYIIIRNNSKSIYIQKKINKLLLLLLFKFPNYLSDPKFIIIEKPGL
jgi:hypothetical protein